MTRLGGAGEQGSPSHAAESDISEFRLVLAHQRSRTLKVRCSITER